MVKNPEAQKKAQEEIDRVIGPDRLASFPDRDSLPYTESIINEVLRLRPPVSISKCLSRSCKGGPLVFTV